MLELTDLTLVRDDPSTNRSYRLTVPHFAVGRHDRVGLIGQSGSGKSTFLEILGLLAWPNELGSYVIRPLPDEQMVDLRPALMGADTETLTAFRALSIGFILQDGGLIPYLSVQENAELALRLSTGLDHSARRRVRDLATEMGIGDVLDRLPAKLSGGQRQRAAVLRAVAPGVALILGDEPTASLDSKTADDVMQVLVDTAARQGATLVLASHDTALLRRYDFRICEVTVSGSPENRQATLSLELGVR